MASEQKQVTAKCPSCGLTMHLSVSESGWAEWESGALIQDALPELTPDQREMLLTGLCAACFDEATLHDDEGDDDLWNNEEDDEPDDVSDFFSDLTSDVEDDSDAI